MPGGIPNPFGFDLSDFMRMLQSPGPVNMEIARSTAEAAAIVDLETNEPRPEPKIDPDQARAFDDVVRAVQLLVSDATGITAALTVPGEAVDRTGWSHATLAGLEPVLGALARALGRSTGETPADAGAPGMLSPEALIGMVMQQFMPPLLGLWAGSMIGLLSHRALGQYDLPLPLDAPPKLLFVVRNVEAFGTEWTLPLDELRYALALREVVHGAQRSVPWVRARLVRLASDYVSAYEVQTNAIEEQLGGFGFTFDPNDPGAMEAMARMSDPDLLLGAMQSERQAPLLAELQRTVAVLEGYTDVVVEAQGVRVGTAHGRIDEALRRHRLERGEATGFVDRLLGLELDRTHYESGVTFCRGVIERSDGQLDQLNRLWSNEDLLPTQPELDAPGLWLARIDL